MLPEWSVWGVHPITPVLVLGYVLGLRLVHQVQQAPMWTPSPTGATREDEPGDEEPSDRPMSTIWVSFVVLAAVLGVAGWLIGRAANVISTQTGLGQAVVGIFLLAIATSLPELVTTLSAVRRGALTLAVSGIIGGNVYDTLFVAISDVAYRDGSAYHVVSDQVLMWAPISILMTAILIIGLIRREEHGPAGIGFESVTILGLYVAGGTILVLA